MHTLTSTFSIPCRLARSECTQLTTDPPFQFLLVHGLPTKWEKEIQGAHRCALAEGPAALNLAPAVWMNFLGVVNRLPQLWPFS